MHLRASDLRFYVWLVRRNLPSILAITVLGAGLGVVVALKLAPTYRATAKLLLEGQQIPVQLAPTTIADTVLDQIAIVEQEITSRSNLLALADKYNLRPAPGQQVNETRIADDLRKRVKFERLPGFSTNGDVSFALFAISFDSPDRDLSAQIVNDIASQVLNRNARSRAVRASETIQFFQDEAVSLSSALDQLESQIAELKTARSRSLPDSLDFRRTQQVALGERLIALDREEASLRSRKLNIEKLAELGLSPSGTKAVRPEIQTMADLNSALTAQLALYSDSSPSVIALRSQIDTMRTRLAENQKKGKASADDRHSDIEPDLVEIAHRLESIEAERVSTKAELQDLSASIEETPSTEHTLTGLMRSRDNTQAQYNATVAKLADASVGQRLETGAQGTRFSVIEPALAPEFRMGPRRALIAAAGAPIGLALGLAIFLLRALLSNRLRRSQDIVKALNIQPLAVIPVINKPQRTRWTTAIQASKTEPVEEGAAG